MLKVKLKLKLKKQQLKQKHKLVILDALPRASARSADKWYKWSISIWGHQMPIRLQFWDKSIRNKATTSHEWDGNWWQWSDQSLERLVMTHLATLPPLGPVCISCILRYDFADFRCRIGSQSTTAVAGAALGHFVVGVPSGSDNAAMRLKTKS